MSGIDYGIIGGRRDCTGDRAPQRDGDQQPAGEEEKGVGHVSAFPMMISAATQDRAATGAGRGWWGGADDSSERAGLEQHLHAGEVGEDCLRERFHAARSASKALCKARTIGSHVLP